MFNWSRSKRGQVEIMNFKITTLKVVQVKFILPTPICAKICYTTATAQHPSVFPNGRFNLLNKLVFKVKI